MMLNRILCVINKPAREIPVFDRIKREILKINPKSIVEYIEYRDGDFLEKSIRFNPEIIITFPFTAITTSYPFYIIKLLTNALLVTYRTEGNISFHSKQQINWLVGMEHYGPDLVDLEIFWGEKTSKVVGEKLFRKNKISSLDRIKVGGYPPFEVYFEENQIVPNIPQNIKEKIERFEKKNTYLLITGFHLSEYSTDELIGAGDLFDTTKEDYEKELAEAIDGVEKSKKFRELYIQNIIKAAKSFPNDLFIVKSHPIEHIISERKGYDPYSVFNEYENILYINEGVTITDLLPYSGIFFHYGSTALADAYLFKIPSVFITSFKLYNGGKDYSLPNYYYTDMGWESQDTCDIEELTEKIAEYKKNGLKFVFTKKMKQILYDVFDIREENLTGKEKYLPSKKIAEILLDTSPDSVQKIDINSEFFVNSFNTKGKEIIGTFLLRTENFMKNGEFEKANFYLDELVYFDTILKGGNNYLKFLYSKNLFMQKNILLSYALLINEIKGKNPDSNFLQLYDEILNKLNSDFFNYVQKILKDWSVNSQLGEIIPSFLSQDFIATIDLIEAKLYKSREKNNLQSGIIKAFSLILIEEYFYAQKELEKLLNNYPNSIYPMLGLIELEMRLSKFELALKNCHSVLKFFPNNKFVKEKLISIENILEYAEKTKGLKSTLKING